MAMKVFGHVTDNSNVLRTTRNADCSVRRYIGKLITNLQMHRFNGWGTTSRGCLVFYTEARNSQRVNPCKGKYKSLVHILQVHDGQESSITWLPRVLTPVLLRGTNFVSKYLLPVRKISTVSALRIMLLLLVT